MLLIMECAWGKDLSRWWKEASAVYVDLMALIKAAGRIAV
jgi:hypothetical protein